MEVLLGDHVVVAAQMLEPVDDEQVEVEVPVAAGGAEVVDRPVAAGIGDAAAVRMSVIGREAHLGELEEKGVDRIHDRDAALVELGRDREEAASCC